MIYQFENLSRYPEILHFVTTRINGISKDNYESLNLSFSSGDSVENVSKNREIVAEMLNIPVKNLLFPQQCHTANVKILTGKEDSDLLETDALITASGGIGIGVLAADCVPILFFDRKNKVIAAAHAGWRGTVKKISIEVIDKMKSEFNSALTDILVGIGPSISQKKYEVGDAVINEVSQTIDYHERFYKQIYSKGEIRYLLNLQKLNRQLLIDCGVRPANIEIMGQCTFSNAEFFYSARRDGFHTGRFGTVICLK